MWTKSGNVELTPLYLVWGFKRTEDTRELSNLVFERSSSFSTSTAVHVHHPVVTRRITCWLKTHKPCVQPNWKVTLKNGKLKLCQLIYLYELLVKWQCDVKVDKPTESSPDSAVCHSSTEWFSTSFSSLFWFYRLYICLFSEYTGYRNLEDTYIFYYHLFSTLKLIIINMYDGLETKHKTINSVTSSSNDSIHANFSIQSIWINIHIEVRRYFTYVKVLILYHSVEMLC